MVEQALPGGQARERRGRGVGGIGALRLSRADLGPDSDELGVAAAVEREHGEDFVAHRKRVAARPDAVHDSSHVAPEDQRKLVVSDGRVAALPDLVVDRIDAGGEDSDQDLAIGQLR